MTVYVCPDKDIVCGDSPANWCKRCPARGAWLVKSASGAIVPTRAAITSPEPLTQARLRELFAYDPASGAFTRLVRTSKSTKVGDIAGTIAANGYRVMTVDYIQYYCHRLVWLYVHGVFPENDIDHKDGDRSNNRLENLRNVSRSVNMQNQKRATTSNRLGLLGVSPSGNSFEARIGGGGKKIHLGTYPTQELAHAAYLEAKRALHEGCTI